jgi:hypothetical protein
MLFKGSLLFADMIPYYIFNPDRRGFMFLLLSFIQDLGVGVFHSMRTDQKRLYEGDNFVILSTVIQTPIYIFL